MIASLAELPDAWDVKVSGWSNDSETSRFQQEGYQEPYACYIKQATTKPVIGTGRFTSPDTMVSQIKRGILDVIGCARPSIADPFLPKKVEEGRLESISAEQRRLSYDASLTRNSGVAATFPRCASMPC
jgi:dimethylamine/trimethylamine dehydrogenase